MKKTIILFLSAMIWLGTSSSCQKAKDAINTLTEFDLPYSTDYTVPATSVTVTAPLTFTVEVATNAASTFASQKTAADKVSEIKLTKMNLQTNAGNFNYLKTITIYIQAPGQPEAQIASKTNVPDGLTSLDLDLADTNLKNYITGQTFTLRITLTADGPMTVDQKITFSETMHVKATLL